MAGPASSIPAWLVLAVAVCVGLYAVLVVGLLLAGRRAEARAVAGFVPDCVVLFKRLLADPEVAGRRKLALVLLLAYLVSPILGQLDDAIVVVLVLRYVLRGADRDALRRLWPGPESSFEAVMAAAYGRSA